MVAVVHAAHRRHQDGARLRVAVPDAGRGSRPGVARRPRDEAGGHGMAAGTAPPRPGDMSVRFATFDGDWKQTAEARWISRLRVLPDRGRGDRGGPDRRVSRPERRRSPRHLRRRGSRRASGPRRKRSIDDGWRVAACPVNGPTLSARGRDVAIAWFTAKDDQPQSLRRLLVRCRPHVSVRRSVWMTAASLGRVDVELLPDGGAVAA